ncbi:MAG: tetrahydrofolate dehydrogenase/cyclohydrolase catalytic domain-containing protein, partial [Alphaproteobacteria bacterium]
MTAQIIDGKQTASEIYETLRNKVSTFPSKPKLAIILVGNDEASLIYVRNKIKAAERIGIDTELHHLSEHTEETEVLHLIDNLNADSQTNGIIVQLPLPEHLNTNKIINRILPTKDV